MIDVLLDPNNPIFWILIISIIAVAIIILARPFSSYIKFVYPNAKFEAMGNPYILEKELNNIIETNNIDSIKEKLNSSKDYKVEGKTTQELQRSLDKNFCKTIEMMKKDSSKKMHDFFNLYLEKNDFYLIKKELKNKLLMPKISYEDVYDLKCVKNKKLVLNILDSEISEIPDILINYGFSKEIKDELSNDEIDFLKLDMIIDRYYIDKLKNVKVPYKCKSGKDKFVNIFIDINNLKNILRAKQMGYKLEEIQNLFLGGGQEIAKWKFDEIADSDSVSQAVNNIEGTSYYNVLKDHIEIYNKDRSVQVFENALDKNFLKQVKEISQKNYSTIGPSIRFLISKEFEIRNLKVVLKGVSENLDPNIIKELIIMEASN